MYLEALRSRLDKLAAKAPGIPSTPKLKTPDVTTPATKVNIGQTPKIKMPKLTTPSTPKLPKLNFPSPESTLQSAGVPDILSNVFSLFRPQTQGATNPQDFMKNLFNNNAASPPGLF